MFASFYHITYKTKQDKAKRNQTFPATFQQCPEAAVVASTRRLCLLTYTPSALRRLLTMAPKRHGARAAPKAKRGRAGDSQRLAADVGAISEPPLAVANHQKDLIQFHNCEDNKFKFAQAVPSSHHSPDKQLHRAESTCIDESIPQPGALVAEYAERYGCRFCDQTVVVLVSEMQNAKSYRICCTACFPGLFQNNLNELDVGTYCGKPAGGLFVCLVHEALLMHHVGNA